MATSVDDGAPQGATRPMNDGGGEESHHDVEGNVGEGGDHGNESSQHNERDGEDEAEGQARLPTDGAVAHDVVVREVPPPPGCVPRGLLAKFMGKSEKPVESARREAARVATVLAETVQVTPSDVPGVVDAIKRLTDLFTWASRYCEELCVDMLGRRMLQTYARFLCKEVYTRGGRILGRDHVVAVQAAVLRAVGMLVKNVQQEWLLLVMSANQINMVLAGDYIMFDDGRVLPLFVTLARMLAVHAFGADSQCLFFCEDAGEGRALPSISSYRGAGNGNRTGITASRASNDSGSAQEAQVAHERVDTRKDARIFPLFAVSVIFWDHADPMVRTSVRAIALNICKKTCHKAMFAYMSRSGFFDAMLVHLRGQSRIMRSIHSRASVLWEGASCDMMMMRNGESTASQICDLAGVGEGEQGSRLDSDSVVDGDDASDASLSPACSAVLGAHVSSPSWLRGASAVASTGSPDAGGASSMEDSFQASEIDILGGLDARSTVAGVVDYALVGDGPAGACDVFVLDRECAKAKRALANVFVEIMGVIEFFGDFFNCHLSKKGLSEAAALETSVSWVLLQLVCDVLAESGRVWNRHLRACASELGGAEAEGLSSSCGLADASSDAVVAFFFLAWTIRECRVPEIVRPIVQLLFACGPHARQQPAFLGASDVDHATVNTAGGSDFDNVVGWSNQVSDDTSSGPLTLSGQATNHGDITPCLRPSVATVAADVVSGGTVTSPIDQLVSQRCEHVVTCNKTPLVSDKHPFGHVGAAAGAASYTDYVGGTPDEFGGQSQLRRQMAAGAPASQAAEGAEAGHTGSGTDDVATDDVEVSYIFDEETSILDTAAWEEPCAESVAFLRHLENVEKFSDIQGGTVEYNIVWNNHSWFLYSALHVELIRVGRDDAQALSRVQRTYWRACDKCFLVDDTVLAFALGVLCALVERKKLVGDLLVVSGFLIEEASASQGHVVGDGDQDGNDDSNGAKAVQNGRAGGASFVPPLGFTSTPFVEALGSVLMIPMLVRLGTVSQTCSVLLQSLPVSRAHALAVCVERVSIQVIDMWRRIAKRAAHGMGECVGNVFEEDDTTSFAGVLTRKNLVCGYPFQQFMGAVDPRIGLGVMERVWTRSDCQSLRISLGMMHGSGQYLLSGLCRLKRVRADPRAGRRECSTMPAVMPQTPVQMLAHALQCLSLMATLLFHIVPPKDQDGTQPESIRTSIKRARRLQTGLPLKVDGSRTADDHEICPLLRLVCEQRIERHSISSFIVKVSCSEEADVGNEVAHGNDVHGGNGRTTLELDGSERGECLGGLDTRVATLPWWIKPNSGWLAAFPSHVVASHGLGEHIERLSRECIVLISSSQVCICATHVPSRSRNASARSSPKDGLVSPLSATHFGPALDVVQCASIDCITMCNMGCNEKRVELLYKGGGVVDRRKRRWSDASHLGGDKWRAIVAFSSRELAAVFRACLMRACEDRVQRRCESMVGVIATIRRHSLQVLGYDVPSRD